MISNFQLTLILFVMKATMIRNRQYLLVLKAKNISQRPEDSISGNRSNSPSEDES